MLIDIITSKTEQGSNGAVPLEVVCHYMSVWGQIWCSAGKELHAWFIHSVTVITFYLDDFQHCVAG